MKVGTIVVRRLGLVGPSGVVGSESRYLKSGMSQYMKVSKLLSSLQLRPWRFWDVCTLCRCLVSGAGMLGQPALFWCKLAWRVNGFSREVKARDRYLACGCVSRVLARTCQVPLAFQVGSSC